MVTDPSPAPTPPVSVASPPPVNQSPLKNRTILIFTLVFLILVTLIAGAYFGKSYFIKKQTAAQPTPKQSNTLTGLEIAKKTALFLDKAVQENGSVIGIYGCTKKEAKDAICSAPPPSFVIPHGFTGSAYYNLFKATKDTLYKEKAEKILQFALHDCQTNKNIPNCLNNIIPFYNFYKETNDSRFKDVILSVKDQLVGNKTPREYAGSWQIYGIPLAILYELTGEEKYLNKLEAATKDFLENGFADDTKNPVFYKEGDFIVRKYDIQIIWDYYIQAYRVTKNPAYLKAVEDFFNKANITNHLEEFKKHENGENISFVEALTDLTELLDNSEKKQIYLQSMYELANQASLDFWDNPDNPKFNGDFGFLINFDTQKNNKPTVHSAWRIRHYLMMGSKTFKIN